MTTQSTTANPTTLRDPNFVTFAVRTVLVAGNIAQKTGSNWRINLTQSIPGFNQGEAFNDLNVITERVIYALSRQYESQSEGQSSNATR